MEIRTTWGCQKTTIQTQVQLVNTWRSVNMASTLSPIAAAAFSDRGVGGGDRTCVLPRTHNTFSDRSFAAAGPRVWNNLRSQLWQDISYEQFTQLPKTFLFGVIWPTRIATAYLRVRNILTDLLRNFMEHSMVEIGCCFSTDSKCSFQGCKAQTKLMLHLQTIMGQNLRPLAHRLP